MKPAKLPHGTLEKLWSDPRNWRPLCIYSCKEDPRWIVPKKNTWGGWTMNFGHSRGWIGFLILLLSLLAPLMYLASVNRVNTAEWFVTILFLVICQIFVCAWYANPKRYECDKE